MNGPFPGVDPWVETLWGDFHQRFLTYLSSSFAVLNALQSKEIRDPAFSGTPGPGGGIAEKQAKQAQSTGQTAGKSRNLELSDLIRPLLPRDLRVSINVDVIYEPVEGARGLRFRPDNHLHVGEARQTWLPSGGSAVAEPPLTTPTRTLLHEPVRHRSLRIADAKTGGRLVAAIELLSPTNKRPGRGLRAYCRKQVAMKHSGVHLLELDLLRDRSPITLAARAGLLEGEASPHHVSLWSAHEYGGIELYAVGFGQPLPRLAVPLREHDEPVAVNLQAALAEAYLRGEYARDTDYATDPPGPPLTPEERAWVDERVAAWRKPAAGA